MNIFLDTTVTFTDPFLKKYYNKRLLNLCEWAGNNLYISQIVLEETRNKYLVNLKLKKQSLQTAIIELNKHLLDDDKIAEVTLDEYALLEKFDCFYRELNEKGIIQIIPYDNTGHLMPIVVERAIQRKKPFSERKDEFRDCLTWLMYVEVAEQKNLDNCLFITENVNDFYADDKKSLHAELAEDSNRFMLYKSVKEAVENREDFFQVLVRHEREQEKYKSLTIWLESLNITNAYIESILQGRRFHDSIYYEISNFTLNKGYDIRVSNNRDYTVEYADTYAIDDIKISSFETEIESGDVVIHGFADVKTYVELYAYTGRQDRDEDNYDHVGSTDINIIIQFSFTIRPDSEPDDLEILDISQLKRGY
ncbi:hypothetical protein BK120_30175 [Paenibacillus sp. FSL A5-0031]|uniref:PIN domain-containing protein n=1 Tax=Paenibacillus sp. FSL A5-0031 TaxID=1920420 RepID=UPI00096F5F7F|nr:PIN domain-containing protein [Paenibacillus sp. FSL A5-0031]OME75933.1 hypothetical protein BK120_30175 [Paenibacillus sp. FSL A5-0031]